MKMALVTGKIIGIGGMVSFPDGSTGFTTESVRYTILASIQNVPVPVEFQGQRPEIRMWPSNQQIDTSRLMNKTCIGIKIGDDIRWHFFEPPMIAGCEPAPVLPLTDQQLIENEIQLASMVGGGGASGASATPGPGGVE